MAFAAAYGDYLVACPTREAARWFATATPGRSFAYEFADRNAPNLYARTPDFPLGAYHGSDTPYLFDYRVTGDLRLNPAQLRLSDAMMGFWSRFAAAGDPGGGWAPTAPAPYRPLSLAPDAVGPRDDFDAGHQCGFWAGIPRPASQAAAVTGAVLAEQR
ncbi:carboxylesterase family protein [Streptomyces thioluteus]|uniref:carboxylesterase family protein n=1 Tax=Streptomyces thioluteus TaxID=66431 RepID=UPI003CD095EE